MANSQPLLLRPLAVNVAVVRGKLPLVCSNVPHAAWVSFFPIHALATPCTYLHRHLYACSVPTLPLYRRLLAFEKPQLVDQPARIVSGSVKARTTRNRDSRLL